MLINLEYDPEQSIYEGIDEKYLKNIPENELSLKQKDILIKIADGIYQYWDCNPIMLPNYDIEHCRYDELIGRDKWFPYGVCDNYHQVFERDERIQEYINDPEHTYILQLTYVSKDAQPDRQGWRWHKWGRYIGDFKPQCEYLYDEEGIDGVYLYNIFEVIKK